MILFFLIIKIYLDLFIHETTTQILTYKENALSNFGKLQKIRDLVEKNDKVAKYLKQRPKTQF